MVMSNIIIADYLLLDGVVNDDLEWMKREREYYSEGDIEFN